MKGIAISTCIAVALSFAASHRAPAQDATALQGTFINEAQSGEVIHAAIDRAIASMSFIARPIARSRLKSTNLPHKRVAIGRTAEEIVVQFDASKPVRMPADGKVIKWARDDGEVFDVSADWQQTALVQTFASSDGRRVNTFRLGPDGSALDLAVTITSPQLKAPVTYTLTYKRTP